MSAAAAAGVSGDEPKASSSGKSKVFQFNIKLRVLKSTPSIWRRVQLYSDATFWDLHCAIQNSMGWKDTHLHCFEIKNPRNGTSVRIGKPLDKQNFWSVDENMLISFMSEPYGMPNWKEMFPRPDMTDAHASWKAPLAKYYSNDYHYDTEYTYDFGDDWVHDVEFEGIYDAEPGKMYPLCIGGERACPPEDTGNIRSFKELLANIKKNPAARNAPEREKIEWLNEYCPNYDPDSCDPSSVVFVNAKEWLKFKKENTLGGKMYRDMLMNKLGVNTGFKHFKVQEKPKKK